MQFGIYAPIPMVTVGAPDLSTDQFPELLPGQPFILSCSSAPTLVLSAAGGSGAPLILADSSNVAVGTGTWFYKSGMVVNVQNGLAVTVSAGSATATAPTEAPEQQWVLTTDGYLVCRANGSLLTARSLLILSMMPPLIMRMVR